MEADFKSLEPRDRLIIAERYATHVYPKPQSVDISISTPTTTTTRTKRKTIFAGSNTTIPNKKIATFALRNQRGQTQALADFVTSLLPRARQYHPNSLSHNQLPSPRNFVVCNNNRILTINRKTLFGIMAAMFIAAPAAMGQVTIVDQITSDGRNTVAQPQALGLLAYKAGAFRI